MKSLIDQLVQGLAEDVALPYLLGVIVKAVQQVHHQLLGLPLGAYDGTNGGVYIGFHEMYGRGGRLELDAVLAALTDYLGLLEGHLLQLGHYYAVARRLHLRKGRLYALVLPADIVELREQGHQVALALYVYACGLAQYLVEKAAVQLRGDGDGALSQVNAADLCFHHVGALSDSCRSVLSFAHKAYILGSRPYAVQYLRPEPVSLFEGVYPSCGADIYLPYGE